MIIADLLRRQKDNSKLIKFGQQSITYSMLHTMAEEKSFLLNHENFSSNIILFLPNGLDFLIAYFAVQYANRTVVPINISASELELADMIKASDCNIVITNRDYLCKVTKTVELMTVTIRLLEEIPEEKQRTTVTDFVKYPVMLSTSGTTFASKFVMLTADNLITNLKEHASMTQLHKTDIPLIVLPITGAYCHTLQMLNYIFHGLSFVIMDKFFTVINLLDVIKTENITWIECVPLMLKQIDNAKKISSLYNLRHIGFGGSNIAYDTIKSLILKYPDIVFTQGYGQTESSPLITQVEPCRYKDKIGSVGKVIPSTNAKILVGDNGYGELIVSGKCIMEGYYKNEKETKKILKDGYLYTGDLARIDEDGYIYILGRINNLIITGGCNVYPEEIENLLMSNLEIEDVRVYGEKSSIFGEIVVAQIVLKNIKYTKKELTLYCKKYLADYKVPRKFYIVNAIPKTSTGKNYRQLSITKINS